jgi:hypothetical protein
LDCSERVIFSGGPTLKAPLLWLLLLFAVVIVVVGCNASHWSLLKYMNILAVIVSIFIFETLYLYFVSTKL